MGRKKARPSASTPDASATDPANSCNLGRSLAMDGKFAAAIEQFRTAHAAWSKSNSPDAKLALREWGKALQAREDYHGAAEKLTEALRLDSRDFDSYGACNDLAWALIDADQFDAAFQLWKDVDTVGERTKARERRIALRGWGMALQQRNDYDKAAEKLKEALGLDPSDVDSYYACNGLARTLIEVNRFEAAAQLWKEANIIGKRKNAPERRIALRRWGAALQQREDYEHAAGKLQEALTLDPSDADSYDACNNLARTLIEAHRFEAAAQLWKEADAIGERKNAPERRIALREWGDALVGALRLDEAAIKYLQALRLEPTDEDSSRSFGRIAHALAQSGRFEDIAVTYRRASETLASTRSEDSSAALSDWGWTLKLLHLLSEAEETFHQALELKPDDANALHYSGVVLADQGRFTEAMAQYSKSVTIFESGGGKEQKGPLLDWAFALQAQEKFDEAVEKAERAVKADPDDFWQHFNHSNILLDSGRLDEALAALGKALARDPKSHGGSSQGEGRLDFDHPYLHHNRAYLLFQLGRFREGWQEWHCTRDCYEKFLISTSFNDEVNVENSSTKAEAASNFALVLTEVFDDYEEAEKYYKLAIGLQNYNAAAWRGLASTYQKWADAHQSPPDIQMRLSRALNQSIMLSKRQLGKGNDFPIHIALADLQIATRDWVAAEECLGAAVKCTQESRLKRGEIDARRGLLHLRAERHTDAVESLRKAVNVQPGDLERRTSLGKAMLRAKRYGEAREEFTKVLKGAAGQIDALIGAAQVCIELAEEGDTELYRDAERYLSDALRHGRDTETGSTRLIGDHLDNVYYLRGYSRVKRWEAEGRAAIPVTLFQARHDFSLCSMQHAQAAAARKKIGQQLSQRMRQSLLAGIGGFLIFAAAAAVFVLAQLDYFFVKGSIHGWLGLDKHEKDAVTYISLTFSGLLFMIAGLYLPSMQKLKVPGVELEKSPADQISKPSQLGISLPKNPIL